MKCSHFNAFQWVACSFLCLFYTQSNAQWSIDPSVNNVVTAKSNRENACRAVTDGSGGAIVVWWDNDESASDHDIYAQRINADGVTQWTSGGIGVCTNAAHQQNPEVAPDGSGGALIAWFDQRNGENEIFLQRIRPDGTMLWTSDGVSVGTVANHYQHGSPVITSDGNEGAIVAWEDWRGTFETPIRAIYAQRIEANGTPMWGIGGKPVTTNAGTNPEIVSDGSGGAIIIWDYYVTASAQRDIYVQRINSNGDALWVSNGLPLCTSSAEQRYPTLVSDGSGGTIVTWQDFRSGSYSNLYAQKVNPAGAIQWLANGVPVALSGSSQTEQIMLSDGGGGAYVVWQSGSMIIFGQRLSSDGSGQWGSDAIGIGSGQDARLFIDGSSGAIITWSDYGDIMAQHVNLAGDLQWGTFGIDVCNAPYNQMAPQITGDTRGGAVIVWDDDRNNTTTSTDIYAQRIAPDGSLGLATGLVQTDLPVTIGFTLDKVFPNPFSESAQVSFNVSVPGIVSLKIFNSEGKEIRTLLHEKLNPGSYCVSISRAGLPGGTYYCRLSMGLKSLTKTIVVLK